MRHRNATIGSVVRKEAFMLPHLDLCRLNILHVCLDLDCCELVWFDLRETSVCTCHHVALPLLISYSAFILGMRKLVCRLVLRVVKLDGLVYHLTLWHVVLLLRRLWSYIVGELGPALVLSLLFINLGQIYVARSGGQIIRILHNVVMLERHFSFAMCQGCDGFDRGKVFISTQLGHRGCLSVHHDGNVWIDCLLVVADKRDR